MAPRPPIGLNVIMTGPGGQKATWSDHARVPGDRPSGINFRTERGSGFVDGGCTLPRDIRGEYVDLGSLNEVQFVGADGSIAYEGSLSAAPRSMDSAHSISPTFVGPVTLAQDRTFSEVYCDRRFSSWGDASLGRQGALLLNNISLGDLSWQSGFDGAIATFPTGALGAETVAELWYTAPDGVLVGAVQYVGDDITVPAGYEAATLYGSSDDEGTVAEDYPLTMDGLLRAATLSPARGYLMVRVYSDGTATTAAAGTSRRFSAVNVVGTHGLTLRDTGQTPSALYLTDILVDAFGRAAPQIDTSRVQQNATLISHYVVEGQTAHAVALDLNKYALWELGVWEGKRLQFEPADLTDYQWEIRLSDPGTTTTLQGQDATGLRNGIAVQFTEAGTGKQRTLTPDDVDELRDDSVENPATEWGRTKWGDPLVLSQPCDEQMAVFAGQAKLAEDNAPTEAGDITITGHVRDRAGHLQPYWKVRAGDTVAITDFPNARPRRIAQTSANHDAFQATLSVDNAEHTVEAFLDYLTARQQAANLVQ